MRLATALPASLALALASAALGAGCGYGFSQRYVAQGNVDAIHVRPFENRSGEPELGAAVTGALRAELARRGSAAGAGAPDWIEGDVRATDPALTSADASASPEANAPTWRIAIEVRARLASAAGVRAQRTVRREVVYLSGGDPLESEGRRALALRRAADEAAQELLRALERR